MKLYKTGTAAVIENEKATGVFYIKKAGSFFWRNKLILTFIITKKQAG